MHDSDSASVAYELAHARWPTITLDRSLFDNYISTLQIERSVVEQRSTDIFLAAALVGGDDEAVRVFDTEVVQDVQAAVRRYGDDDFRAEVLQRLRVHLLVADNNATPRISRYDGRASLRSWVGICAVRLALYMLRGERNQRDLGEQWSTTIAELPTGDPALDHVKSRYAETFRSALLTASEKLTKRERAMLRLRFAHGASVDEIAATYAVHRVTAWRWLSGARDALLEHALAELRLAIPADDVSLGSLLTLVQSRIDLSVVGLFKEEAEPLAS